MLFQARAGEEALQAGALATQTVARVQPSHVRTANSSALLAKRQLGMVRLQEQVVVSAQGGRGRLDIYRKNC